MDFVILGANDDKWCYNVVSIDTCVKERYFLASDLIVVVKMKSAQSSRGDIRSLVKDDIKTTISTSKLKNIQDSITSYFKKADFAGWLVAYNRGLSQELKSICYWFNDGSDCDVFELTNNYQEEKHQQAVQYKKKEFYLDIRHFAIIAVLLVLTFFSIRFLLKKHYIKQIKKILVDLTYRESVIESKIIFPASIENFKRKYQHLRKDIEIYLADKSKNLKKTKKEYKRQSEMLHTYDSKLSEEEKNYSSQREIADEIEDLKKIDL